jgi:AP-2 complex subunit beta-1
VRVARTQEFRAELQAAGDKDKKGVKRRTALKKIVANITMGNDSVCRPPPHPACAGR